MQTKISTKLAALGIALMMNSALIGAVAYLFDGQLHGRQPALVSAQNTQSSLLSLAVQ